MALIDSDLTSAQGLQNAVAAGKALLAAMNAEIHPALVRLAAVQEQRKRFDKWKTKFSQAISRHLNNLFIHLVSRGYCLSLYTVIWNILFLNFVECTGVIKSILDSSF